MTEDAAIAVLLWLGLVMSLTLHEIGHAVAADWCGDDSARLLGRFSLNPIRHIDPVMTIIVPFLTIQTTGRCFGGAKPVPVNPSKLRRPRTDMALIAAAGPAVNVVLAVLCGAALNFVPTIAAENQLLATRLQLVVMNLLHSNMLLAAFNLLPLPPLDGSKILAVYLPRRWAELLLSGNAGFLTLLGTCALLGAFRPLNDFVIPWSQRLAAAMIVG